MPTTRIRPTFDTETITVEPWLDPIVDEHGVDPRSSYVEDVWLGILGPSTVWLLRKVAAGLDAQPEGFPLDLAETAATLGLGGLGRNGAFMRSIGRACQFGLARPMDGTTLAVRRHLPPATQGHLRRLPESVRLRHDEWMQRPSDAVDPKPAERIASELVLAGQSMAEIERVLRSLQFHPAVAHRVARDAARPGEPNDPIHDN